MDYLDCKNKPELIPHPSSLQMFPSVVSTYQNVHHYARNNFACKLHPFHETISGLHESLTVSSIFDIFWYHAQIQTSTDCPYDQVPTRRQCTDKTIHSIPLNKCRNNQHEDLSLAWLRFRFGHIDNILLSTSNVILTKWLRWHLVFPSTPACRFLFILVWSIMTNEGWNSSSNTVIPREWGEVWVGLSSDPESMQDCSCRLPWLWQQR